MIKYGLSALYKMLGAALTAQYTLRAQGTPFRVSAPPEDPRYWHQGALDEKQYARMQAAERHRERRATKLHAWALWSADNNRAHYDEFDNLHDRHNPFYVAK